tara:strand:- start:964 stop:1155 length:192 start_codon:yes stop_codon:yes gene_type:complete
MKMLLKEIEFQIEMLDKGMIVQEEFTQAIEEIYQHYNKISETPKHWSKYSRLYKDALKWFRKS